MNSKKIHTLPTDLHLVATWTYPDSTMITILREGKEV